MRLAAILLIVFSIPTLGLSATILVPGDYSKIQEAIDAAVNGDVVLVHPDTYTENIDFKGKAILVKSALGPVLTVIDGNEAGNTVTFESGEGIDSIIEGFTITNGISGIFCDGSSPLITRNSIVNNSGDGGIYCCESSAMISCNIIACNSCDSWQPGGGISCWEDSSPFITGNVIEGNCAGFAGGIWCWGTSPIIVNNTITKNMTDGLMGGTGGGICCGEKEPLPIITNTIIRDNLAGEAPEIFGNPEVSYCNVKGGWPGTGNIDADPLFVDPADHDYHLTFLSPCKDAGDGSAVLDAEDFEGDPRIANGVVDMGADEFHRHMYWTGDATPGGEVALKFVGVPGAAPVMLLVGSGVLDPPLQTAYGDWYLQLPLVVVIGNVGFLPSSGVLVLDNIVPPHTAAPLFLPMQAGINSVLSNLSVMEIE